MFLVTQLAFSHNQLVPAGFLMFHWIPRFPRWQRRRAEASASLSGRVLPVLQASSAPPPVSSSSLACLDSFRCLLRHPRLRLFPGNHGRRRRSPHLEGEGALDVIFFLLFFSLNETRGQNSFPIVRLPSPALTRFPDLVLRIFAFPPGVTSRVFPGGRRFRAASALADYAGFA